MDRIRFLRIGRFGRPLHSADEQLLNTDVSDAILIVHFNNHFILIGHRFLFQIFVLSNNRFFFLN